MRAKSFLRRYQRFWGVDPVRDVDDELAFHIEMRIDELVRAGWSEPAAREATMKRFGNYAEVRDECRTLGRERVALRQRADRLDALKQDLRFATRTIAKNPVFAVVIVLTMAIGIGINSAVFSVAYGVLLRPLPFRDADALVRLWSKNDARGLEFFSVSPADYRVWRATNGVFSGTAAFERQHEGTIAKGGDPEAVDATAVTPDIFPLLGTSALHGRPLLEEDASPDAPPVAVMSHELWSARFGSDSSLIGSRVTLDDVSTMIVGVMPPRFVIPGTPARIWTPLSLATADDDHSNRYLRVLARLAPGTTLDEARGRMNIVAANLARDHPETNASWSVNIMSVPTMVVGTQFRRAVTLLLGVVGFVLLIACSNAANLQLARAAGRGREIALRVAIGATRGRIVRQLLTESTVLAVLAGAAGLVLAYGGIALLRRYGESSVPRLEDVHLDAPVLLFTAALAVGSGLLFGLVPAFRASRPDIGETLKEGGRGAGEVGIGRGIRAALVIAQVSLSLVLLIGAGLLMRSFARLQSVDVGFDSREVSVVQLRLPEPSYPDAEQSARFYETLLERVRSIPGVASAEAVSSAPFAGPNTGNVFARVDRPVASRDQAPDADFRVITPGYLKTLGIPVVRGRAFTEADRVGAPPVVLISESLARRHWPNEDPIGGRMRVGDLVEGDVYTVVGVVGDARYQSLEAPEVRPMIYFSALARPQRAMAVLIKGGDAAALSMGLREIVATTDSRLPPPHVVAMDELMRQATSTRRFALVLFGVFAAVALMLAAIGVYGVMSYLVRQRMHELGIRIALGAPNRTLVASVVGRTLAMTLAGVAIGVAGALALTRSLSTLLFDVSAHDPATFAAIAALMALVAVIASAIPARRATKADPMLALRGDG
ncbi:MAG TPA: ABC transporter permease [Gemmatimonadaceae bacterium]|nr:ABC transporter permease [Gemmatimonadaceae bacterium]